VGLTGVGPVDDEGVRPGLAERFGDGFHDLAGVALNLDLRAGQQKETG
jgi:hypothetical protein